MQPLIVSLAVNNHCNFKVHSLHSFESETNRMCIRANGLMEPIYNINDATKPTMRE